jgi:hypothetical protein
MAVLQSVDDARAERVGRDGVTAAAYADALARSADGIDPFAQPAVEEGKVLAKRYLTATA